MCRQHTQPILLAQHHALHPNVTEYNYLHATTHHRPGEAWGTGQTWGREAQQVWHHKRIVWDHTKSSMGAHEHWIGCQPYSFNACVCSLDLPVAFVGNRHVMLEERSANGVADSVNAPAWPTVVTLSVFGMSIWRKLELTHSDCVCQLIKPPRFISACVQVTWSEYRESEVRE